VPQVVRTGWRLFSLLVAFVMAAAGLAAVVAVLFLAGHPKFGDWAEPHPLVAFGYAAACALLAVLTWRGRHADDAGRTRAAVLAMACFMVLSFTGMLTNARVRRSEDQASDIARLKERLPKGQRIVSFGHVDLMFVFYYGGPIERLPMPTTVNDPAPEPDVCFCFNVIGGQRPNLPFAWQELGAVSMVRNRTPNPERMVVIGRRLSSDLAGVLP
jgi:hypothetical protein